MSISSLVLLSILFQSSNGLNVINKPHSDMKAVDNAEDEFTGRPVFYLIVMGKLAYRHQVSTWLSSLRGVGNWRGEAVIVTDKPGCLAKTLQEAKLLGTMVKSTNDVDIYNPGPGYAGNTHIVKRPTVNSVIKMKLEKARAWHNMKTALIPHRITSIVYTDEDVVIGKDLTNFMADVKNLELGTHTLALFRDTGAAAGELHTGLVIMFPGPQTDQCLQSWAKHLSGISIGSATGDSIPPALPSPAPKKNLARLNEEVGAEADDAIDEGLEASKIKEGELLAEEIAAMGPDQQALGRTRQCKKAPDHAGIKILPGRYFWLPTPEGMRAGKRAEFVHFTNTGRWNNIPHGSIKSYMYKIGIPRRINPMGHVVDKTCQDL